MSSIRKASQALALTFFLALAAFIGRDVFAQQLIVATGDPKGTYSRMLKEAAAMCQSGLSIQENNTTGSIQNVNMLVGNEVNAAVVQADVLFFRAASEDLTNVKTLIALHPEEVHVISTAAGRKEGGMMGFGGSQITIRTFQDLDGRVVAAAGGSAITARLLAAKTGVRFQVAEVNSNAEGLQALKAGQVDALIAVGGSPLGIIAELTPEFNIVPISSEIAEKVADIYTPARLSYTKMEAAGVPTLATQALFVTRDYRTDRYVNGLVNLRECVVNRLPDLQETTGMHPKWSAVSKNKGKWPLYQPQQ